jgi:CRISPR/Cas system CSM-associated protein Csm3 (group 7 of RAMP superfamily)
LMAAKFKNSDGIITGNHKQPVRRDGVGINRDTEVAQDQIKYDFEVLDAGASFEAKLYLENADESDFALLYILLQEWKRGVDFGGKRSRGLGRVVLKSYKVEFLDPDWGRDLPTFLREGLASMNNDDFETLLETEFGEFTARRH